MSTNEMNTQHTPEPWFTERKSIFDLYRGSVFAVDEGGGDPWTICHTVDPLIEGEKTKEANAARIAACVNACAGMPDPAAEIAGLKPWALLYRDGKTLEEIAEILGGNVHDFSPWLFAPLTRCALQVQKEFTNELAAKDAESARLAQQISTLLEDSTYVGGVQYWIRKHDRMAFDLAGAIQQNAALSAKVEEARRCVDRMEIAGCYCHERDKQDCPYCSAFEQLVKLLEGDSASALQSHDAALLKEMESRKDAAYLERNQVVAALAKCFPSGIAKTAIEGWSEDWHSCVYIDLPTGQVSWHFHDSQAYLFDGLPAYVGAWDGHTTEEKYQRLAALSVSALLKEKLGPVVEALEVAKADSARIDSLEALLKSGKLGNGLAFWPYSIAATGECRYALQDLGDEDGSNLGEEIENGVTLRDAIDATARKMMGGGK